MPDGPAARRGRPSRARERTDQIVDAFVALVAERGLEAVTLHDVAERAGVKRPTIRHYLGNRPALVRAAFATLKRRYDSRADHHLGTEPSIEEVAGYLLGESYTAGSRVEDLAFAALLVEAQRDPDLAATVRESYQSTIDRVAATAMRERPGLAPGEAQALAYQVLCLAEFNVDLQRLGFDPMLGRATADTVVTILRTGRASHPAEPLPAAPPSVGSGPGDDLPSAASKDAGDGDNG